MKVTEVIYARGHENIKATHKTTMEITKDPYLTPRGDCIIAVKANKAAVDLNPKFKTVALNPNAEITIKIEVSGIKEIVKAWGSEKLTFTHLKDMVIRKSQYVCGRTIAVKANKAALDLPRRLVEKLKNPKSVVKITLTAMLLE